MLFEKLKKRWGVESWVDVVIILVVFACTGFSIMGVKRLFNVSYDTDIFLRILFYIGVFFLYQVFLLAYGWLFGKFRFFWNFEKRMLNKIWSWFVRRKETE